MLAFNHLLKPLRLKGGRKIFLFIGKGNFTLASTPMLVWTLTFLIKNIFTNMTTILTVKFESIFCCQEKIFHLVYSLESTSRPFSKYVFQDRCS